jgi:hypothetical protein
MLRTVELRRLLVHLATPPLAVLAVLLLLIEEYLWDGLVRLGAWVGRLPVVRGVERRIAALPPAGAMVVLLVPAALALPVKLLAVWLMAAGHLVTGVIVLLSAKVTATAFVARVYTLCEPALATVPRFVRLRDSILRAKDWAHRKLEATLAWRLAQRFRTALHGMNPGPLARRWRVLRRRGVH